MIMKTYGDIGDVHFEAKGYNLGHLNYEYAIFNDSTQKQKTVYVSNMKDLKSEISKFNQEV